MTYDIYRYIFIGAAILSGVMLVVSIILFILFKIPKVISDLSGATARKAIKNIREQNEASGDKGYRVSAFNEARGKLTDKITPSGNIMRQNPMQMPGINTTKIDTQKLQDEEHSNQTTVLNSSEETFVLEGGTAGETSVLSEVMSSGETTVLSEPVNDSAFAIEYEITFIHTNELITMEAI